MDHHINSGDWLLLLVFTTLTLGQKHAGQANLGVDLMPPGTADPHGAAQIKACGCVNAERVKGKLVVEPELSVQ